MANVLMYAQGAYLYNIDVHFLNDIALHCFNHVSKGLSQIMFTVLSDSGKMCSFLYLANYNRNFINYYISAYK